MSFYFLFDIKTTIRSKVLMYIIWLILTKWGLLPYLGPNFQNYLMSLVLNTIVICIMSYAILKKGTSILKCKKIQHFRGGKCIVSLWENNFLWILTCLQILVCEFVKNCLMSLKLSLALENVLTSRKLS